MSKLNFRDGSTIPMVTLLITAWGSWPCPPDLMKLYDAAPKRMMFCETELMDGSGMSYSHREVPDESTTAGSAYYARERELINAIDTIEATGNLCVVAQQS